MKSTFISLLMLLSLVPHASKPETQATPPTQVDKATTRIQLSNDEMAKAAILIETVQLKQENTSIRLTGTIQPNQTRMAKVLPTVPGRIVAVCVQQGDKVQEGQIMARLESVELGEARANYRQSLSEVTLADAAFERAKLLIVDDIMPKKEYLSAKADAERAHATLTSANTKLRLLHAARENIGDSKNDASYPLVSPLTGTVTEQFAVRGEWVQTDHVMFSVADLSTLWVEADVFEKDLANLTAGLPATITVPAYADLSFSGTLIYLNDVMNQETHTVKARIAVANPEKKLKPGMFASVLVSTPATNAPMLILPNSAVTLIQGQNTTFVQDEKGFEVRAVEVEPLGTERLHIKAGLNPGERVVMSGVYELKARLLKSQIGDND